MGQLGEWFELLTSTRGLIWLANAGLLLVVLKFAREVIWVRRRRAQDDKVRFIADALSGLGDLSDVEDELGRAWASVLATADDDGSLATAVDAVVVLSSCATDQTDGVREIVRPIVNRLNGFAAYIDEGLVKPTDVFRRHPDIHESLLRSLPLVVPFIWYESVARGMGRWGYRVLRLDEISIALRPLSSRERVRGPWHVEVAGRSFRSLNSIGTVGRFLAFIRLGIRSPSIDTRSKVRQTRQRDILAAEVGSRGVVVATAARELTPIEW